jgi:hypothetical protein
MTAAAAPACEQAELRGATASLASPRPLLIDTLPAAVQSLLLLLLLLLLLI